MSAVLNWPSSQHARKLLEFARSLASWKALLLRGLMTVAIAVHCGLLKQQSDAASYVFFRVVTRLPCS